MVPEEDATAEEARLSEVYGSLSRPWASSNSDFGAQSLRWALRMVRDCRRETCLSHRFDFPLLFHVRPIVYRVSVNAFLGYLLACAPVVTYRSQQPLRNLVFTTSRILFRGHRFVCEVLHPHLSLTCLSSKVRRCFAARDSDCRFLVPPSRYVPTYVSSQTGLFNKVIS